MINSSEYVSAGHPDKVCDAIASYILDKYIAHDPKVRFAVEVQLKDHICNLAGEVTSTWNPSEQELSDLVRAAIRQVGYTAEYAAQWPDGATLNADKVRVYNYIGQQSPDIAQGVDREGWGDQGVFAGMATNESYYDYMPRDVYFARRIGQELYNAARDMAAPIGLDIKTLVSLSGANSVEQVIVAAPMIPGKEDIATKYIEKVVKDILSDFNHTCNDIIINGTGAYVIHSSVGDAGVVGRKLAVDFYGLNSPIGGGAPWGKDPTKADVTLNLAARYLSLKAIIESEGRYRKVFTKIACCIGRSKCLVLQYTDSGEVITNAASDMIPSQVISHFGLNGGIWVDMFYTLCENGLFTYVDKVAIAETTPSNTPSDNR